LIITSLDWQQLLLAINNLSLYRDKADSIETMGISVGDLEFWPR
jgi:hypothetical protein